MEVVPCLGMIVNRLLYVDYDATDLMFAPFGYLFSAEVP
jgi:hypothetical protein